MSSIMVDIEKCPIGAVLAEDVITGNGVVILRAGVSITEDKLSSLIRYGLVAVVIESGEKMSDVEKDLKKENIRKYVDKRMRKCKDSDVTEKFKSVLVAYLCKGYE